MVGILLLEEIIMDWSTMLQQLLPLLAGALVGAVLFAAGKAATSGLKRADEYLEENDLGAIEPVLEIAISCARTFLQNLTGAERMDWVVNTATGHGVDVDRPTAEAIYQKLCARWKAETAAATAATAPAAETPATPAAEVTPDA